MTLTLRSALRNGTTYIEVEGVGAPGLLVCIGDVVATAVAGGPVVLDLSGVLLVSPEAVRALVDKLRIPSDHGRLRIVCARLSARRMLHQFGDGSLALFSTPIGPVERGIEA